MTKENINIIIGIIIFCIIAFLLYRENGGFTLGFLLAVLLFQFRINRNIDKQKEININVTNSLLNQFKMIEGNSRVIGKIVNYLQGNSEIDKSNLN